MAIETEAGASGGRSVCSQVASSDSLSFWGLDSGAGLKELEGHLEHRAYVGGTDCASVNDALVLEHIPDYDLQKYGFHRVHDWKRRVIAQLPSIDMSVRASVTIKMHSPTNEAYLKMVTEQKPQHLAARAVVPEDGVESPSTRHGLGGLAASVRGPSPAEHVSQEQHPFCKLDLRCARIVECVCLSNADTLYRLQVSVGSGNPRQVVANMRVHYKPEELQGRKVVLFCNMKPVKFRGCESQGMLLCANVDGGFERGQSELLTPPSGAEEGMQVMCDKLQAGSLSSGQTAKQVMSAWDQVRPALQTNEDCAASLNGTCLTLNGGLITVPSLNNTPIH